MVRTARREGIEMTVETCPHYLVFEAQAVADGATQFKCCPPIREATTARSCGTRWAVATSTASSPTTRPAPAELKRLELGDFGQAWGGISSLQLGLSAVWTEARQRGYALVDVVRWMAERPAYIARLQQKGQIERGYHADFAVFAPDDAFVVDPERLHHRNRITPYAFRPLAGVVRSTWLRGRRVTGEERHGRLISRGRGDERDVENTGRVEVDDGRGDLLHTDRRAAAADSVAHRPGDVPGGVRGDPAGHEPDIVTSYLPFWRGTRLWVLARPLSGFAPRRSPST